MVLCRLIFVLLAVAGSIPDEGQWLPQQFLELDWEALKARGLTLTKDEFWHPTEGGVLSAAVQVSGCSASFVSTSGLVVTNHHCGFGAIEQASTVEKNYLRDGFVASTAEAEIPARGMTVAVVKRIDDVTEKIHAAQALAKSDTERLRLVEQAVEKMVSEAEKADPDVKCSVASFLNGRTYHLYHRTQITDVRLVYAPPRAVGEFGGEDDNWMWPRHTGDFAFFRAYVGPDQKPRPYSKDNVPYAPKHFLKVARAGAKEGDLAMVLGYPGRTERYLSSAAVQGREEELYPVRYRILTGVISTLEKSAATNPEKALRLSTQIKSLANTQKNALGMVKGLARNGVHARKLSEEKAFSDWAAADEARKASYGGLLKELLEVDRKDVENARREEILSSLLRFVPLVAATTNRAIALSELKTPEAERDTGFTDNQLKDMARRIIASNVDADVDLVQVPTLVLILKEALSLPQGQRIVSLDEVLGDVKAPEDAATFLLKTSGLLESKARKELLDGGDAALAASEDPLVRLGRGLASEVRHQRLRVRALAGQRLVLGLKWIEAQEKWRGRSFYPDANSTLRVSVATLKGYEPKDGVRALSRTRLAGVIEKETGEEPFASPKSLLAAAREKDLGRFVDPDLQDVPVCFLTDADTTGGNSGSPIINGKGELIGLNFDRVFENVAGDFGWNASRSRNIGVDIRYVLWNLDKVLPAPELLIELGF